MENNFIFLDYLFIEIINDDTYFKLWGKSTNFFGHLRNNSYICAFLHK